MRFAFCKSDGILCVAAARLEAPAPVPRFVYARVTHHVHHYRPRTGTGFRRTSPSPLSPRNRRDRRVRPQPARRPLAHERRVRHHHDWLCVTTGAASRWHRATGGRRGLRVRLITGKTEGRLDQRLPPVRARVLPRQPMNRWWPPPRRRGGAPRPPRRRRRATLSRRSRRSRRAPGPGGRF